MRFLQVIQAADVIIKTETMSRNKVAEKCAARFA